MFTCAVVNVDAHVCLYTLCLYEQARHIFQSNNIWVEKVTLIVTGFEQQQNNCFDFV